MKRKITNTSNKQYNRKKRKYSKKKPISRLVRLGAEITTRKSELKYINNISDQAVGIDLDITAIQLPLGGIPNSDSLIAINTITQGAAINQRIGNIIKQKTLYVKGNFYCNNQIFDIGATPLLFPTLFLSVIIDTQPNGSATDVVGGTYTRQGGGSVFNMTLQRNNSYTERFIVLKEEYVSIPPSSYAVGFSTTDERMYNMAPAQSVPFKFHVKLDDLKTQFLSTVTSNAIAGMQKNAIYVMAVVDHNQFQARLGLQTRIRFED